jgi:pimeloyl-ACP methyl ester carboxylesterase
MRVLSTRRLIRAGSVVVGLLLVVGAAGINPAAATISATQGASVPGDQPLPPYTIVNPPLAPATVGGQPTTVRQGVHEHAAYIIEVPPSWNGDLVMWTHGYRGNGTVLTVDPPGFGLRQKLLDQGYAWAASSYAGNGYDIRTGVLSTRSLADLFGSTVDRPHRTYVVGVSLGGHVIGRSLEQYPDYYDGALPMCGVMGDQELFDYFLDYNLAAQTIAGVSAYPIPTNYVSTAVPQINAALGTVGLNVFNQEPTNDLGRQFRAITIERSGGDRPGSAAAFAFWKDFLFNLAQPAVEPTPDDPPALRPGQIATNVLTWYEPNEPVNVNRTILRVFPEDLGERVSPFLTQIPKIFGRPDARVLSVHGLGDLFVPFSMERRYAFDVALRGESRNLVQRAIRTINHCEFSPAEIGGAWDDLVDWVEDGTRPAGDRVLDSSVVAAPNYGCTFSDPAAYAAGAGTRRLFPACP